MTDLVFLVLLIVLAYWHKDVLLYCLAGFSIVIYAVTQALTFNLQPMTIILVVFGIYCFVKAKYDKKK